MRYYWGDILAFSRIAKFFSWRGILFRYKQTAMGVTWPLNRSLLTMLTFTIIFGHIARVPSHGGPYPILVFTALRPWQFFSTAFAHTAASLIQARGMTNRGRRMPPANSSPIGRHNLATCLGHPDKPLGQFHHCLESLHTGTKVDNYRMTP